MNTPKKNFYLFGLLAVGLIALLCVWQFRAALGITVTPTEQPLIEKIPVNIPLDQNDAVFGNQGAPVSVVEFIDLNSADSLAVHQTLKKFVADHPTDVYLTWKDFPTGGLFTTDPQRPHRAAYCVLKQDRKKFWEFIDQLASGGKTSVSALTELTDQLSLNAALWQQCLDSTEAKTRIDASIALAEQLGLDKAPIIFINNKKVNYVKEINLEELLTKIVEAANEQ